MSKNGSAILEVRACVSYLQEEARALRHKSERHHCRDARQCAHNHEHPPAVELVGRTHAEAPACHGERSRSHVERREGEKWTRCGVWPCKHWHLSVERKRKYARKKNTFCVSLSHLKAESHVIFHKLVKWLNLLSTVTILNSEAFNRLQQDTDKATFLKTLYGDFSSPTAFISCTCRVKKQQKKIDEEKTELSVNQSDFQPIWNTSSLVVSPLHGELQCTEVFICTARVRNKEKSCKKLLSF